MHFYSEAIDDDSYKIFVLPSTYFVLLTGNANDSNDLFYSAMYLDKAGYVKKCDVVPVDGTPITPFASKLSFRVFVPNGTQLRSTPECASPFNIVTTIPFLTTNLVYYGALSGEEQISQKGNLWYYCKFIDGASHYLGYIYAPFCDLLPPIVNNNEVIAPLEGEPFAEEILPTETENANSSFFTSEVKILLIAVVTLPCFIIIYLLFKPTKLTIDNGKNKKKIHKLKKSEYYELD